MQTDAFAHRSIAVISDLHLSDSRGAPGLENFTKDDEFARFLCVHVPQIARGAATLVLAGDFIDFVRVPIAPTVDSLPRHVGATEADSRRKLAAALDAHPRVVDALKRHLDGGNQVVVLPGNHDVDWFWRGVRSDFAARLGHGEPALLVLDEWSVGGRGLYVAHGHQYSYDNRFTQLPKPFVEYNGELRLERCWGTFFMEAVYNDIEFFAPWVNKVHPESRAARLALRHSGWDKIPPPIAGRVLAFFMKHGKQLLAEHVMGFDGDSGHSPWADALVASLGDGSRADEVRACAARILADDDSARGPSGDDDVDDSVHDVPNTLGIGDQEGIAREARRIFSLGDVHSAIFGHTHRAFQSDQPSGRVINTGTWTGAVFIDPSRDATITFPELQSLAATPVHRLTYAFYQPELLRAEVREYVPDDGSYRVLPVED